MVKVAAYCYSQKPSKSGTLLYRKKLKSYSQYDVNILYFAQLQFSRQEWSVAPLIFNIKEWGLAHCIPWAK